MISKYMKLHQIKNCLQLKIYTISCHKSLWSLVHHGSYLISNFLKWSYRKIWNWGKGGRKLGGLGVGGHSLMFWGCEQWNRGNRLGTTTQVKIFVINSQNNHIKIISIQSLPRRQHPISSDNHIFPLLLNSTHKNLRETSVYIITRM